METYSTILIIFVALLATLIYTSIAIIAANETRSTRLSFIQLFLISFFLTPLAGATLLFISKKITLKHELYNKCLNCGQYSIEAHNNCHQCTSNDYSNNLSLGNEFVPA